MKIVHLIYVLIVVICISIIAILYQKSRPIDALYKKVGIVRKEFRYKVKTRLVTISQGKGECLGKIELPTKGKSFILYFLDEYGYKETFDIARISVEDEYGKQVMYDWNWASRGERARIDSVNLRGYQKQDNEYFEFIRMPGMLKCHVKPNRSKFPRIIKVIPDYYRTKPTYVEIVQAGKP